ncbi:NUDIX hydrolase [Glycomyces sp. L485]|uniref:NUDIX hydrolase n=1 Tax=Glycomyces sp. L485 TaxID=2909235 RepID=UPI001F4B54D1|nr:NUDIX domain-containing protein [Glycomyces sp. L485]MCH7229472.1 NUDIX hydrolase [Glycomyces sp. L485]
MGEETAPAVFVAADIVILTIRRGDFEVLLVRRGKPPFKGELALPGGFLEPGETVDQAAGRELREETALWAKDARLEQVGVYSDPDRDPRQRVVSVAYAAMVPDPPEAAAGGDAADTQWISVERALNEPLAFDHRRILTDAVEHARRQLEYTTAATAFCREEFTVAELRRVYEIVWQTKLDPGNFHRKVTRIEGFLEPTGETTTRDGGRPAGLYRAGTRRWLQLPLSRPDRS